MFSVLTLFNPHDKLMRLSTTVIPILYTRQLRHKIVELIMGKGGR